MLRRLVVRFYYFACYVPSRGRHRSQPRRRTVAQVAYGLKVIEQVLASFSQPSWAFGEALVPRRLAIFSSGFFHLPRNGLAPPAGRSIIYFSRILGLPLLQA